MIYRTFGGPGADYVDYNACYNAVQAAGVLADDETWTVTGSHVCNTVNAFGLINLGGSHTIRVTCPKTEGAYHFGNPNDGYRITAHCRMPFLIDEDSDGGGVTIENLNIWADNDGTDAGWDNSTEEQSYLMYFYKYPGTAFPLVSYGIPFMRLQNVVAKKVAGGINQCSGLFLHTNLNYLAGTATPVPAHDCYADNIKLYNFQTNFRYRHNNMVGTEYNLRLRNITSYNHSGSSGGNYAGIFISPSYLTPLVVENCIACSDISPAFYDPDWYLPLTAGQPRTVVCRNCADSDGSIALAAFLSTENIKDNLVPADIFESTDQDSDRFLFLRDGSLSAALTAVPDEGQNPLRVKFGGAGVYVPPDSALAGTGIDAGGLSEDIAGNPRPAKDGLYSIGCHEVLY